MGRGKQLPPDEPRYLPSTTRAVAWGALFFSFLAFLMSGAALMVTWQEGRLMRNASQLVRETREAFEKKKGAKRESAATSDGGESERSNVRQQLDTYVQMIKDGDKSARFYLDGLKEEVEGLRARGRERGAEWMTEASVTIQKAREDLATDTPEAVRKLQELAKRLSTGEKSEVVSELENEKETTHGGGKRRE